MSRSSESVPATSGAGGRAGDDNVERTASQAETDQLSLHLRID